MQPLSFSPDEPLTNSQGQICNVPGSVAKNQSQLLHQETVVCTAKVASLKDFQLKRVKSILGEGLFDELFQAFPEKVHIPHTSANLKIEKVKKPEKKEYKYIARVTVGSK